MSPVDRRAGGVAPLLALGLAAACAEGDQDRNPPPPMLGPNGSGSGDAEGSGTAAGSSTGIEGEAEGSGEATAAEGSGGDGAVDTTAGDTGPTDACAPDPTDIACFACGKQLCCEAYAMCEADPLCTCTLDCIDAGGMADPCNQMCGLSDASTVLLVCAYLNCETECQGI